VRMRSRGVARPRFCMNVALERTEGAGKAGCRLHPWVPCNKKHGGRTTGSTGITPAFPAQWFTAYFALSPVTGLSCHRRRRSCLHRLDASVGASGPHDFAVRWSRARRSQHPASTASHRNVRDDREPPLIRRETRGFKPVICPTAKAEYFCARGWTRALPNARLICPSGQSAACEIMFRHCERSEAIHSAAC
jgi:hypothetical protein